MQTRNKKQEPILLLAKYPEADILLRLLSDHYQYYFGNPNLSTTALGPQNKFVDYYVGVPWYFYENYGKRPRSDTKPIRVWTLAFDGWVIGHVEYGPEIWGKWDTGTEHLNVVLAMAESIRTRQRVYISLVYGDA